MSMYNDLPQVELADLLRAYDCYIATAADAGLLTTGWTPVCVDEFYENEYQNVWDPALGAESFDYMYGEEDELTHSNELYLDDVRIFRQDGQFMCQFEDEDAPRILRSRIQDIEDGDAFIVGEALLIAEGDAHQNLDEPDEPWIVYDDSGNGWFEEDIVEPGKALDVKQLEPKMEAEQKLFIFDDELYINDSKSVNGYLWATEGLVNRMRQEVIQQGFLQKNELETMDNPNFHVTAEFAPHSMELVGTFHYYTGETEHRHSIKLPLSKEDSETLMRLMDAYCMKEDNVTCLGLLNEYRTDNGFAPLEEPPVQTAESQLTPVHRVDLIRERLSENQHWSDTFWVDAKHVPSVDLFRAAVQDYLQTGDGRLDIENTCEDFNWGDAMMYVPDYAWNNHGIYPADLNRTPMDMGLAPIRSFTFTVNQDEVLIPDSYFEEKESKLEKPPLAQRIAQAADKASQNHNEKTPNKEFPQR